MSNIDKAMEMVKELNNNIEKTNISIPLLEGFEIQNTDIPNIIFIAKNKDNFTEQFIKDNQLEENEDYNSHVNKVVKDTEKEMKKNNFLSPEKNILFYKNINNYKTYIQNNIFDNIIVKQLNAYILDSNNVFYQITVSTPPISLDKKMSVTIDNNLNESLYNMLSQIVTNIKEN